MSRPMITNIRCLDVETTGLPPDAAVCEVGFADLACIIGGINWCLIGSEAHLINPGRFIPPEASAIHHIVDADVKGKPRWSDLLDLIMGPPTIWTFAAHNMTMERFFFDPPGLEWIDTMRCAFIAWPDAPNFKLQTLRYYLGLTPFDRWPPHRVDGWPPHRAGGDALTTAALLDRLLTRYTAEQLVEMTAKPPILPRVFFKKHYGKRWEDVDDGYLRWCLAQKDMDPDVKSTCRHHLEQRGLLDPGGDDPPPVRSIRDYYG